MLGAATPNADGLVSESNYEVWDPLNWMLDGLVEFPYSMGVGGQMGDLGVGEMI